MRYTPETYARAFLEVVTENSDRVEEIITQFRDTLARNGDIQFAEKIVSEIEKLHTKKDGGRNIVLESARELSSNQKKELVSFMSSKDSLKTKITPSVIAGARITIDDEWMIDASLGRRLNRLFSN